MTKAAFADLLQKVIGAMAGKPIDARLADHLNTLFPPQSATFQAIEKACHQAIAAGWMCAQGVPARRFGRVIEPSAANDHFSVDVVDLTAFVGPHHRHPKGEICLVMPVDATARFDGNPAGWCVYPPGSAHHPTVTAGRALVLYLLPDGLIDYSAAPVEARRSQGAA